MTAIERLNQTLVVAHVTISTAVTEARQALGKRLDVSDDRGDVEARTITIAVMAALALAIGAIITQKVTTKANSISLDNAP